MAWQCLIISLAVFHCCRWCVAGDNETNLALMKRTYQSSYENPYSLFSSNYAVDGITNATDRYFSTSYTANQWWKVDLGDLYFINRVLIFNRLDCCRSYMQKISILASITGFNAPSLNSTEWNRVYYQETPFEAVLAINITHTLARYLALFGEHYMGLTMEELEAYGVGLENFALNQSASQSSTLPSFGASLAVDGNILTNSVTRLISVNQWWKIQMEEGLFISSASVLLSPYSSPGQSCSLLITGNSNFGTPLNSTFTVFGNYVFGSGTEAAIRFASFPWITQLAIVCPGILSIYEVKIYGFKGPFLSFPTISSVNTTFGAVSFSVGVWNNTMVGDVAPDGYSIYLSDGSSPERFDYILSVRHPTITSHFSVSIGDLSPSSTYRVFIMCEFRGITRLENNVDNTFTVTTASCYEPSTPNLRIDQTNQRFGTLERINLAVNIERPESNCLSLEAVNVKLSRGSTLVNMTSTNELKALFTDLDPYTKYEIEVTLENNKGLTSSVKSSVLTLEAVPYDAPTDVALYALNSSCVELVWSAPLRANGELKTYDTNCWYISNGTYIYWISSSVFESTTICSLTPATRFTCLVRGATSQGFGPYAKPVDVFTHAKGYLSPVISCEDDCLVEDKKLNIILKFGLLEDANMTILSYLVIIERSVTTNLNSSRPSTSRLLNYTVAMDRNERFYVTAEINSSDFSAQYRLALGDGSTYGRYFNAPFSEGMNYSIWLAESIHQHHKNVTFFQVEPTRFLSFSVQGEYNSDPISETPVNILIIALATTGGAILTIIIVVIISVITRRRQRLQSANGTEISGEEPVRELVVLEDYLVPATTSQTGKRVGVENVYEDIDQGQS